MTSEHFYIDDYSRLDNDRRHKIENLLNKFQPYLLKEKRHQLSSEMVRQYIKRFSKCDNCSEKYDIQMLVKPKPSKSYVLLYSYCKCEGEDLDYEFLTDHPELDHDAYFKSFYVDREFEDNDQIDQ